MFKLNSILGYLVIILTVILILWVDNHYEWFNSVFLQRSLIGLIYFIGLIIGGLCFIPQNTIPQNEKKLWQEIRKQGKTRFILNEIFEAGYHWLIVLGLVGLLLARDYFREDSFINNLGLYAPIPLIMLFVRYYTATKMWKESERLIKSVR
jgi:hypothetical protein